jgi:molecular chaperone GrpE (heat shock protein)
MPTADHAAIFTSNKGRSSRMDHPAELSSSTELQQASLRVAQLEAQLEDYKQASLRVAQLEAQLEDYKRRFATEIVTT